MTMTKKLAAEFIGTFWLVTGGVGSAIFAAKFGDGLGIGLLGVSLAFGLTVVTMAFAIGHISGCHLNPAVSIGLAVANKFPKKNLAPYIITQTIAAIAAALFLRMVITGDGSEFAGLASNGVGEHSPGGFNMMTGILVEIVMTFMFLIIILGATSEKAPKGFAPLAIGLGLTLIHLISIPVTNTSVNPARSTGPALIEGGIALQQLWIFWVAPIAGAALAGLAHRFFSSDD